MATLTSEQESREMYRQRVYYSNALDNLAAWYIGEPADYSIDKSKVFKGIPGSIKPVAIMENLERVTGDSVSNRIKMFMK